MKNFNASLRGFYKIEAVKPNGERRTLLDWFDNLILDAGLNRLGSGGAFDRCMVGTSSSAVLPAQTTLGTQIASTTTIEASTNGVNIGGGYAWARRTFRFGIGTATGNITEVGVGWTSTLCFSRALTVDGGGTPVTVTVLADEYLDVTYELRMHWPTVDISIEGYISASAYNVITRAAQVGSWTLSSLIENGSRSDLSPPGQATSYGAGALGDITVDAGGTALNSINLTYESAYVNNSLQRLYRATFGLAAGSASISNLRFSTPFGIFKSSFDPAIPKTVDNNLTLDYRITWGRFTAFSGVNPSIGTITVEGFRETTGTSTVSARVEFRSDGAIYVIRAIGGGSSTSTTKVGEWHIPNSTNIGAGFDVQFTGVTGSGGTYSTNASSYLNIDAVNAFALLTDTGTVDFLHTRALTYNVRAEGGGSVLATGTITLSIERVNA